MILRRSPMVLALLACIALAGCNGKVRTPAADAPATVSFQHLNGTTEVKKHPQRVVVLDYASLETLQLLGVEPLALPGNRTMLPDSLKQYQNAKYLNAGTLFEPDMATLRAAKPDLILIAGRSSKAYAELSGIAPTLNMAIDPQDQLGSLKQRTLQLGELFDKQPQAQAGLVVLFSGGKISAYAPKSRFSFTYDALGFQSALQSDNADVRGNKLTPEQVAQLNPDWLFIIDRDAATGRPKAVAPQKILTTTALKNTAAVKKGQVVYLPAAEVYLSGGIITSQHIVERVAEALNKK